MPLHGGEGILDLDTQTWREACAEEDLGLAARRLAPLLFAVIPAATLVLRRLDRTRRRLETVAASGVDADKTMLHVPNELPPETLRRLDEEAAAGAVSLWRPGAPTSWPAALLPAGLDRACLTAPLGGPGGCSGLLVLIASSGRRGLEDRHARPLRRLLVTFSAVLERDRLLHELCRCRETAAAEQRALSHPQDIAASIVGAETGLRQVMERVDLVAHTDAPVLILGETGSGKEVVARAIHSRSRRAAGTVVRVNCGAIPPELIDSELFGHERGSFTGAVSARRGWFERADGGTLFLDEVGELALGAQVRLLRILQDGTFERVGGQQPMSADIRIVAATHRDLPAMIREGRFREDLWYRLSVFPIRLPPLRERREDIPALAGLFAENAGLRLGALPLVPSPEDLALLLDYDWPGNIRELAAVIERAAILGNGRRLEVAKALGSPAGPTSPPPVEAATPAATAAHDLNTATARHIESVLTLTAGRIEGPRGAAALLGINPHTLRARMRKLGIAWARFRAPGR